MKMRALIAAAAPAALLVASGSAAYAQPVGNSASTGPHISTWGPVQNAYDSLFCLAIPKGKKANGTQARIFACSSSKWQRWVRVHVVTEDNIDTWVLQNQATDKCLTASGPNLGSKLVEEKCDFGVKHGNIREWWGIGSGAGACPNVNESHSWVAANLNHYPDGDWWPSKGNFNTGVLMYEQKPYRHHPLSQVCWTLPNEVSTTP